jgi:DNA polymerase III subunit alpha
MWVNLHAHSEGSLMDGLGSPSQRAEKAKELKQTALSISDHGNLIMVPRHIDACNKEGIKSIVGMEAYFKPDRMVKDQRWKGKKFHLLLLAKNEDGWKNLVRLSTEAQLSEGHYKNLVDYELLKKYSDQIICSSACIGGYLPSLIQHAMTGKAEWHEVDECIERHMNLFGDDYFLEIMHHDTPIQKQINTKLANYSIKYGIPLVATADSHYPYPEWKDTQDAVFLAARKGDYATRELKKAEGGEDVYDLREVDLWMPSEEEVVEGYALNHTSLTKQTVLDAIEQSQKIADSVEPFEIDKSIKIPKGAPSKKESEKILEDWSREGIKRIGKDGDEEYEQRLSRELNTLSEMGVADYFVIVGKMVRWARSEGIRISSGRGSAAGSLICYLIKITTIDPIKHNLLFERFLNENRKGLPDIDLDFEHERRDEVKKWLAKQYGADHVSDIVSLQTYGAKSALKEMARVYNIPFAEINTVTKVIPEAKDVGGAANIPPLDMLRKQYGVLDKFANQNPDVWKHAIRIESHTKGLSTHAAGVVVTDKPIIEYMPLMQGKSGIVTGWSDTAEFPVISDYGFLKIDILGLDGLTKQGNTVRLISEKWGKEIDLDLLPVAQDPTAIEEDVMRLFQRGHTLGIFQFGGSRGITSFLRHVKPDRFEDLIAANALYRPGPLEGGDAFKYGDLKQGKVPIEFWHESVKPFLATTYGIMCYQEQLQQIAQALGKFSPSASDDMRKATSKLYRMGKLEAREFMSKYKEQWMKGCNQNGLSDKEAEHIWERMIAFGAYSFNRSHSASYALFAYQDAWLKYHYPHEFYASLLTYDKNPENIIREAKLLDVTVGLPDINLSDRKFTITNDLITFGLERIKYIGPAAVEEILKKRPFDSFEDFCQRVNKGACGKRVQEYLVMSGSFDSLGERDHISTEEKREMEKEALDIALSGTVDTNEYSHIIDPRINSQDEFERMREGSGITIGGELSSVKHHIIKNGKNKGKKMAFVNVSYKDNSWDCTLFMNTYEKYHSLLKEGNVIMLRGRKGERDEIIANSLITIEALKQALEQDAGV